MWIEVSRNSEIDSISKEINCAEHEYMNMPPSLIALATPLVICMKESTKYIKYAQSLHFAVSTYLYPHD